MFRGCYFEFAGKSSEPYNLMLYYKDNNNKDFDSGGEFELKTDSIPYSYEQFLYGKDYSSKPLEFEVEIVTPEGNIPLEQMVEIKNWLFNQDGWRDLTVSDDTQSYHLKCVLIPSQDITDVNGYRGVRCTIHNASPFWYGEEVTLTFSHDDLLENKVSVTESGKTIEYGIVNIYIPENGYAVDEINPILIFRDYRAQYANNGTLSSVTSPATDTMDNIGGIALANATTISQAKTKSSGKFSLKNTNAVWFETPYLYTEAVDGSWGAMNERQTINTMFATIISSYGEDGILFHLDADNILPFFNLHEGDNICRIRHPSCYAEFIVKYTPVYRLGAF